jgi:hypothetical protein
MSNAELKQAAMSVASQLRTTHLPYSVKVHHLETEEKFNPKVEAKAAAKSNRSGLRSQCQLTAPLLTTANQLMAELNKRTGQHIAASVLDSWVWFDCDAVDRTRVERNIKQMEFLADQL